MLRYAPQKPLMLGVSIDHAYHTQNSTDTVGRDFRSFGVHMHVPKATRTHIHLRKLPDDTVQMLTNMSKAPESQLSAAAKYILSEINTDQAAMPDGDQPNSKTANIRIQVDAAASRD